MAFDARLDPILTQLTRHPAALDALDALGSGPLTRRELSTRLRSRRRVVDASLRVLAAHGLIDRRGRSGTWDLPMSASCQLTGHGHDLARQLKRFETLTVIYELLIHGDGMHE